MLEEVFEEPNTAQETGGKTQTRYWRCDCTQCIHVEEIQENTITDVLAITRSKKNVVQKDSEQENPINWED